MISLIVSTFNDTENLTCCLMSLASQTYKDMEIIVANNSTELSAIDYPQELWDFCDRKSLDLPFLRNVLTGYSEPYEAAEEAMNYAKGDWIGFPSSDGYYMPIYLEAMMNKVGETGADFVYCDLIYDRRAGGKYKVMASQLRLGAIDKTNFLMKRSMFKEFPEKSPGSFSDWYMIERLIQAGAKTAKVDEVLVVHN